MRCAGSVIAESPRPREERAMAARDDASPTFQTVLYDKKGPVCYITLNRPEKLNAATDQLVEDVNDALFEFDADPDLHVAILSGAGRAFCSGADVQQRQLRTPEEMRRLGGPAGRRSRDNNLGEAINWKPVIAAVHGYALGLGYSLSQSCDLWWPRRTQFQIREVQRGLGSVTLGGTGSDRQPLPTGRADRRMFTPRRRCSAWSTTWCHARSPGLGGDAGRADHQSPPLAVRANVRVRWFVGSRQSRSTPRGGAPPHGISACRRGLH
jgi:hypothetical protein